MNAQRYPGGQSGQQTVCLLSESRVEVLLDQLRSGGSAAQQASPGAVAHSPVDSPELGDSLDRRGGVRTVWSVPVSTPKQYLNSTGLVANPHRHVGGVWTLAIVAEWLTRCKSRAHVERASWRKCFMDPSLKAHAFKAALAGDSEEIVKHRAGDTQAAGMLSRVHRLQLGVLIVEPLKRADRGQLPAAAETEKGDGGIEQVIDLERVRILWRAV